jgi:glycosyltransferase involved in cell wall biosynthesis
LRKAVLAADTSFFYPVAEPDENEFCVLYVGQISFRKGIPYLLEAFKRLSHPKKRLRMIGAVEPRIRKYLQTAPLAQVEFEGNQPRDVVREAMSKAHVTVLPSVEDGFGMVLAEAMACGCPVISTENTGGADLYQDGCQGLIIPIRSGDEIYSALNYLAECPHIRAEMGERARQRMSGYWSGWKQYGDTEARHLREHVAVCA